MFTRAAIGLCDLEQQSLEFVNRFFIKLFDSNVIVTIILLNC